jgi:hypothetical protein
VSHDGEPLDVVVLSSEFGKMKYLLGAIRSTDRMFQDFKSWRESVLMNDGVSVDVRIDWRSVVIHCMPQVMVILNHDTTGNTYLDHPLYAVLPESNQFISLRSEIHLSVKERDDAKAEVDVHGALNVLSTYAQSIDGGKRDNALRQIRILQRILK